MVFNYDFLLGSEILTNVRLRAFWLLELNLGS